MTQWNLVFGVAGIFSLTQMMVFAIGGYVAAVLARTVIGFATLRLRGARACCSQV